MKTLLLTAFALLGISAVHAAEEEFRILPATITDRRVSGRSSSMGLQVDLRVAGNASFEVRSFSATATAATDDAGNPLDIPDVYATSVVRRLPREYRSGRTASIQLSNPPRTAKSFSVEGFAELYVPTRDPEATVTFPEVKTLIGKAFEAEAFVKSNLALAVYDGPSLEKARAAEQHEPAVEARTDDRLASVRSALSRSLFNRFGSLGRHELAFVVTDPEGRLADYEIQGADGIPLQSTVSHTSTDLSRQLVVRRYQGPLPEGAKLVCYVMTAASTVRIPFHLKDVKLP